MPGNGNGGHRDREFDELVLDEDFIRGGVHEPSAAARAANALQGRRASPRLIPPPASARVNRLRRFRSQPDKMPLPAAIGTALLTLLVIAIFIFRDSAPAQPLQTGAALPSSVLPQAPGRGPAAAQQDAASAETKASPPMGSRSSAAVAPTPTAAHPTTAASLAVYGLGQTDPGTCYREADFQPAGETALRWVHCAALHRYEIVSSRPVLGSSAAYPTAAYWPGPAMADCRADLARYIGTSNQRGPAAAAAVQADCA